MKKYLIALIVIIITSIYFACEKDDICEDSTPTTPKLIIEFYDNASPSTKKNVTDLKVVAEGEPNGIIFNSLAKDDAKYRFTGSKIAIPLKTNQDFTNYSFTIYDGNAIIDLINEDKIQIQYTRNNEFISRACGYKTTFKLNSTNSITREDDSNNWIKDNKRILIQNYDVLTENDIHVKIFI